VLCAAGKLVHQHHVGAGGDVRRRVEVGEGRASVGDCPRRDHLEVAESAVRLRPAMLLDPGDHDPFAVLCPALTFGQHGRGLADPRGGTQVGA
jgi:hypothetical protein